MNEHAIKSPVGGQAARGLGQKNDRSILPATAGAAQPANGSHYQINPLQAFADAIQQAGLGAPEILADGAIHRFATPDDKRGKRSGWYCLHDDQHPAGQFGDWRSGRVETWSTRSRHDMSFHERADFEAIVESCRKSRAAETAQRHTEARRKAAYIWANRCQPAPADHRYLARKAIQPHGARIDRRGNLVIPVRDLDGQLWSLQFIAPDGSKRLLSGGAKKGHFCQLGPIGGSAELYIAEGFATAATIHEVTEKPVSCAIDSGNLQAVALAILGKYPEISVIVACDDDAVGRTKGIAAAMAVQGRYVIPDFSGLPRGERDSDFNDLARLLRECGQ